MMYLAKSRVKVSLHDSDCEIDSYGIEKLENRVFKDLEESLKDEMREMGSKGLAEYFNEGFGLNDVVTSIIVKVDKSGASTEVETTRELTVNEIEMLKNYLIGQYADGWGEGFEQTPIHEYEETYISEEWDEEEQEVYEEETKETIEMFIHFYQSGDFEIDVIKL